MLEFLTFLMAVCYLFAGLNHFLNARFYSKLIPPYLAKFSQTINHLSGMVEIVLAIGLLFDFTRTLAANGIIFLLIVFIPAHIYMIQLGVFKLGRFTITPLISWARLVIIHPLLIIWAWWIR